MMFRSLIGDLTLKKGFEDGKFHQMKYGNFFLQLFTSVKKSSENVKKNLVSYSLTMKIHRKNVYLLKTEL